MLPQKLAFLDTETTGMSPYLDRIIEIGILRVEDGQLIKTYHSLIDPQTGYIPDEITMLTGIKNSDLASAPSFRSISEELVEILDGCVMVAHNARFDYSFLRHEFKRLGIKFTPKQLCTVKLSRKLFPRFRRHDLSSIIERFNLECGNRHRAFDDAKVLWDFYQLVLKKFNEEKIAEAINLGLRRPTLPANISLAQLKSLPESPGVYIFYGSDGVPLYIGKSINLKDRVMSHFSSDHSSPIDMKINQTIQSLEVIKTAGELGALLLESELIKTKQPLYNRRLRHSRQLTVIKSQQNKDGYLETVIEVLDDINPDDLETIIGTFKSNKQAKQFLLFQAKEHQLCEKLLGLEKTTGACFSYRLGRCLGGCVKKERPPKYNLRFLEAFVKSKIKPWPFKGPVAIQEGSDLEGVKAQYIVDKWCCLDQNKNLVFDVDSYQILRRYLTSTKNQKNVRLLSRVTDYPEPAF